MPGPSSSCVPWSKTPPGATAPRPLSVRSPSSSGVAIPWTPGNLLLSWLLHPRPTRSRAYASPSPLPFPAQGSLPARAGSPLAGRFSHPLDDRQGFMKSSHTPFLLDQPCLVAPPPKLTDGDIVGKGLAANPIPHCCRTGHVDLYVRPEGSLGPLFCARAVTGGAAACVPDPLRLPQSLSREHRASETRSAASKGIPTALEVQRVPSARPERVGRPVPMAMVFAVVGYVP